MKYINKYLEYLKVVKKYSDKTIESYYDDLTLYNEFLGNNFINIFFVISYPISGVTRCLLPFYKSNLLPYPI